MKFSLFILLTWHKFDNLVTGGGHKYSQSHNWMIWCCHTILNIAHYDMTRDTWQVCHDFSGLTPVILEAAQGRIQQRVTSDLCHQDSPFSAMISQHYCLLGGNLWPHLPVIAGACGHGREGGGRGTGDRKYYSDIFTRIKTNQGETNLSAPASR